jgi:hypothetical protein
MRLRRSAILLMSFTLGTALLGIGPGRRRGADRAA